MTTNTTTFSGDASLTKLAVIRPQSNRAGEATISVQGTFGGGTFTLFESLDGGTTKIACKDISGTAYSTTTNDSFRYYQPGHATSESGNVILYGTLSGSTNPSLSVIILDNQ